MTSLTSSQQKAFDMFLSKKNLFICGSAGNGKSYLVNQIRKHCLENYMYCVTTSTTGTSAVNINGKTIHSVFGLKPWTTDYTGQAHYVMKKNKMVHRNLYRSTVLIIDEVSMLDNIMFDGLSEMMKIFKNCEEEFGGVQLILVGDIFQLPPVKNSYCFLGESWKNTHINLIELKESVRQESDERFYNILQEMRLGKVSKENYSILENLKNTVFPEGIIPTKLYSKNVNVDKINQKYMQKLVDKGEICITYKAEVECSNVKEKDVFEKSNNITLCKNSQVMVTRNISLENSIVNGTRGIVTELGDDYVIIKTLKNKLQKISYVIDEVKEPGREKTMSYLPIKLAYAMTIHKSQGATIDCMEIDLGKNVFNCGQAYTGLSRAKNLDSIKIKSIEKSSFKTDLRVLKWYNENVI